MFTSKQYAKGLYELCKGKEPKEREIAIREFAHLLFRHNAARLEKEIIREFENLYNGEKGFKRIEVVSMRPLNRESKKELEEIGSIKERIDSALLGGVRVLVDDTMVDGSIKTSLSRLKKSLRSS